MGRRHFLPKGTTTLFLKQKFLITLFLFLFPFIIQAQQKKKDGALKLDIHGFIKTDFWVDSRNIAGAREKLFLLYPLEPSFNEYGRDVNDKSSFNFSAITSRVNLLASGPEALDAKLKGFLEADFSGISNTDVDGFRLRHAYIELDWGKSELLLGQYWHPMFVNDVFPTVLALNTGSPFQPFIRNPQIRFTQKLGNFRLIGAALSQLDYASDGPGGRSSSYLSNALVPNLHMQLKWIKSNLTFGGAIDYKRILPEILPDEDGEYDYLESWSKMIYAKYNNPSFTFKLKYIHGENMTEHLMLGGYLAKYDDIHNRYHSFRPTSHHSLWINGLLRHKGWEFGAFAGYTVKDDFVVEADDVIFARGINIDHAYRFSPLITLTDDKFKLCFEAEYTIASYGGIPTDNSGKLTNPDEVENIRLQLTGFLFF